MNPARVAAALRDLADALEADANGATQAGQDAPVSVASGVTS